MAVNFGVVSSVSAFAESCFKLVPLSSYTLKLGLAGGIVSLSLPIISSAVDLLPELSIAITEPFELSVKAGEIVIINLPFASAVPVPITLSAEFLISIFAFGSAVPVTVVPSALI